MNENIDKIAKDYAIKCHTETNHLYDNRPYQTHLNLVVSAMERFSHLIPEKDRLLVRAACWVHDVIEDCRQTYNDVRKVCGEEVAEIAYALTNEKGKNRKERASDRYYQGILDVKYASFVKLCDRIANMEYSHETGNRMFEMYCKENGEFVKKVSKPEYDEMVIYLLRYSTRKFN